jgi:hypothetical protein
VVKGYSWHSTRSARLSIPSAAPPSPIAIADFCRSFDPEQARLAPERGATSVPLVDILLNAPFSYNAWERNRTNVRRGKRCSCSLLTISCVLVVNLTQTARGRYRAALPSPDTLPTLPRIPHDPTRSLPSYLCYNQTLQRCRSHPFSPDYRNFPSSVRSHIQ